MIRVEPYSLREQLYDLWRQFPRKGDTKFGVKKQAGSHYLVEISGLAQNVDMLALVDLTKRMKNLAKEAGLLLEGPGSKELDPNRCHGFSTLPCLLKWMMKKGFGICLIPWDMQGKNWV